MTEGDPDVAFEPFFLETASARLFCNFFPPLGAVRGSYLYVPPFAEEMNRSRSMVAMQSRALAARGFGVLLVDLLGTGDSSGEFVDGTWQAWKESVVAAHEWLKRRLAGARGVWGLRLGAMLAGQLLDERAITAEHAIFWQPVTNPKAMLTQFLRIKVAAAMDLKTPGPSTDDMRKSFKDGQSVEVGGYELNPQLGLALDSMSLTDCRGFGGVPVDWLEVSSSETPTLGAASPSAIDKLRQQGATIVEEVCGGPLFWQLHERTLAPSLIRSTTAKVLSRHG